MYVADTGFHRVQKFDSDGYFRTEWGDKSNGEGQYLGPRAIAVDAEGSVYVVDTGNHRVQRFIKDIYSSNDAYVFDAAWGIEGSDLAQFGST